MMEYRNDVEDKKTQVLLYPLFHYSIIPWPRPGFHMAPVIILMSRQGGPIVQRSGAKFFLNFLILLFFPNQGKQH